MYESNDNEGMFNSENRLIKHVNEKKIEKSKNFINSIIINNIKTN